MLHCGSEIFDREERHTVNLTKTLGSVLWEHGDENGLLQSNPARVCIADVTARVVDRLVPGLVCHLEGHGLPVRKKPRKIARSRPNEIKVSPNSRQ
jgi:hypothetical protein